MEKPETEKLIEKYLAGKAGPEECTMVESWYLDTAEEGKAPEMSMVLAAENKVWKQLSFNQKYKKTRRLWFGSVAAILVTTFLGIYFYSNRSKEVIAAAKIVNLSRQIKPGTNKAVLILSDGKKVILTEAIKGKIASQTGVRITKSATGQLIYTAILPSGQHTAEKAVELKYNTILTPAGGQYQVNLPDGTRVWINASSSLKFPIQFAGKERRVELSGEAYFEVTKDESKPFKVATAEQEITVFGTHFNVNAYVDEDKTKTTLLTGSVKVRANNNTILFLKPGEQSVLAGNNIKARSVDVSTAVGWKNGLFVFDNEKIAPIMRRISRWYNVDIVYRGKISDEKIMGSISRYQDIHDVLEILELTDLVHFKIEERRIIVMP
ncbi:FecR family protein [Pedobacter psychrodurus]|uniref:FecR family protein n=1 Tax=Pedobacter psychrodurus TaxID=2530456 RepID=UPI00292F8D74|nr:FecR domain-containing protein [Pedobacter psychrodurus]